MPRYIVAHSMVGGAEVDGHGATLTEGEFASPAMFPAKGAWERLVRLGAVREATKEEAVLAEARAAIREAQEAPPGTAKAQELADARAKAERVIAEPPRVVTEEAETVPVTVPDTAPVPPVAPSRSSSFGRRNG